MRTDGLPNPNNEGTDTCHPCGVARPGAVPGAAPVVPDVVPYATTAGVRG